MTCPKGTFSGPLFNPLDPDTQIKMRHGGFKHCLCLVLWLRRRGRAPPPGSPSLHSHPAGLCRPRRGFSPVSTPR